MATRIVNRLPQFIDARQRAGARAVTQALILGASEASVLTPIDTSTLLNSQYRDVDASGPAIRGIAGYTAEYALPVHDPDNPQNFRRPSAEKEFLSKGFERSEPQIRAIVRAAMKA
jgi:hypothetical protein